MTEREAWLELAKDAGRLVKLSGMYDRALCGITHNGLCDGIVALEAGLTAGLKVTAATARRMHAIIRRERATRRLHPAYLWPLTSSGFRRRVTFCNKQAARLARGRAK